MVLQLTIHDIFHEEIVNPVSVNFDNVTYWQRNYVSTGTDIFFVDGLKITVKQQKEQIDKMLGLK